VFCRAKTPAISRLCFAGPGLIFMVYPVGLSLLPLPKVWSVMFFATLFMVGIDTQVIVGVIFECRKSRRA